MLLPLQPDDQLTFHREHQVTGFRHFQILGVLLMLLLLFKGCERPKLQRSRY